MFEVYAQDYRITIQEIPLGNQGEDMARCLVIDITDAVNEFGSGGTVSVRNKRNGDELPYFCTNVSTVTGADAEGNVHTYIKWTLTDVDTAAAGSGFVQADYIISGTTVKTWVYKYFILPSLGITGDVPDPYEDILEEIEAQVSAVQTAAASAAASAAQASAEATRIISTTQQVVEDWLSDHIVTGYTVDDTLTISGAAADSATVGTQLRAAFVTEQTSGSIASFADGADGVPLKDLVVNITPKQAGTGDPSPSNVRAISGWTEANVFVRGVNLWNEQWANGYWSNGRFYSNANFVACQNPVPVKPNTTYYFHSDNSISFEMYALALDGSYIGAIDRYCFNETFTTDANTYFVVFNTAQSGAMTTYVSGVSVNYPSTDTTYHAYDPNSTVYNISFASAGTVYGGTLDVTSGMLTVTHKGVDMGTLAWVYRSGNVSVFSVPISDMKAAPSVGTEFADVIADAYTMAYNASSNSTLVSALATGQMGTLRTGASVYVGDGSYSTAAAFKAAVTGQTLVYELAQPISVQLDPVSVASLIGNNNIWSDTGSVASCEYRADTKLYLEKLTNPDSDMVADSNITSGSYFMVNNNLYLATANIANGGAITPGTNCTATNLAAALNAINS